MIMSRGPKTTADLLTDVKLELFWPSSDAPLTDAELLRIGDKLLEEDLCPLIMRVRSDFLTSQIELALGDPSTHENAALYGIPLESMARIEAVIYVDPARNEIPLTEYKESDLRMHDLSMTGYPAGYFFRGGRIGILPHPDAGVSGHIRIRFNARPMQLVEDDTDNDTYRVVSSVNKGVTTENISFTAAIPSGWDDSADYQALSGAPPHVPLEYIPSDKLNTVGGSFISAVQADQWPYSSKAVRSAVQPGDIVIRNFRTTVIQLPVEAYGALVSGVAAYAAKVRGDREQWQALQGDYMRCKEWLSDTLRPRNAGQRKVFVNHSGNVAFNGPGMFRGRRW